MGRYMDFYNSIQSPIEQEGFIEKLLDCCDKKLNPKWLTLLYQIYGKTMHFQEGRKWQNPKGVDLLYSSVFNDWKNAMVTKLDYEWYMLYFDGKIDDNFDQIHRLVDILKKVPDAKTRQDIQLFKNGLDEESWKAYEKYSYDSFCNNTGDYLESEKITVFKDKRFDVEHRLYINVKGEDLHEFIYTFISICKKYQLPYSIKYYDPFFVKS